MTDDALERIDPILGTLKREKLSHAWTTKLSLPEPIGVIDCVIYDRPDLETNLQLVYRFKEWTETNAQALFDDIVDCAFDMDIIQDEEWNEERLARELTIDHVGALDGVLSIAADPKGAVTDHLFNATLDENHKIVDMHT